MGDQDEGDAEPLLDVYQLELGALAQLLVQGREGLVQEQHLRPLDHGAGERDALALAAGELMWPPLREVPHLDQLQRLADPPADFLSAQALPAQAEGDVSWTDICGNSA